jgi:hypothetical protein
MRPPYSPGKCDPQHSNRADGVINLSVIMKAAWAHHRENEKRYLNERAVYDARIASGRIYAIKPFEPRFNDALASVWWHVTRARNTLFTNYAMWGGEPPHFSRHVKAVRDGMTIQIGKPSYA